MGRYIIIVGLIMIVIGGLLYFTGKVTFIGKLPGDIFIKRDNFIFYAPIVTSLLLSLIISLLFMLFNNFKR